MGMEDPAMNDHVINPGQPTHAAVHDPGDSEQFAAEEMIVVSVDVVKNNALEVGIFMARTIDVYDPSPLPLAIVLVELPKEKTFCSAVGCECEKT
ncbi:hypothetical protein T310_2995 [Rasamsonia emersonii CBS 393.64]|uniref:Uncharacterized protein n=1 Tax=Rasamsonia emersonii (strain ATCC 16479 / CBS 393.64 / IMI 116815) TaxID=1408163 RepID=A0A0F4YYR2_RASE3|nr:hypothetical protein T310_2995 [Rasamsonia emersonii CBS 393.64]KKA22981.1 hypothetical protein T310_2995 [Rasamsonia emersonii CBS 393.64]